MGDGKTVKVKAIGKFRLLIKTGVYLDLKETYVVPSFRRNLITISVLDKSIIIHLEIRNLVFL